MKKKPRILVVDDVDLNIRMVAEVLEKDSYSIVFAKNGRQALEISLKTMPDIILLDIVMPGLSGYDVCRELKSRPETRDIPVIFLTAQKTDFEDILSGFQAGGADYVTKPFNPAELNARVRTHLDLKLRTQALRKSEAALKKANENLVSRATELEIMNEQLLQEIEKRIQTEKELLKYQAKLRSMTAELVLSQEQQRRRAAVEIHESIGQVIGVIKIRLGALRKESAATDGMRESVEEILRYIDQTIREIRSVSYELSPPILYEIGLEAAISSFIEKIREKNDVRIEFTDDGQEKYLDIPTRIHLYQCIRELIFNSINHGQARYIRISVCKSNNEIQIRIDDDGIGFDSSQLTYHPDAYSGFGLFSIRERMKYLGGAFEIRSASGQGTGVFLSGLLGKYQ